MGTPVFRVQTGCDQIVSDPLAILAILRYTLENKAFSSGSAERQSGFRNDEVGSSTLLRSTSISPAETVVYGHSAFEWPGGNCPARQTQFQMLPNRWPSASSL